MGATSLLNVTCGGLAILPGAAAASRVARLAVNPKAIVFITVLFIIRVEKLKRSRDYRLGARLKSKGHRPTTTFEPACLGFPKTCRHDWRHGRPEAAPRVLAYEYAGKPL